MEQKDVIYFTKEDGKNKFLMTSTCFVTSIDTEQIDDPILEKILGHKPQNLYAFVDGTEFEILSHEKYMTERESTKTKQSSQMIKNKMSAILDDLMDKGDN